MNSYLKTTIEWLDIFLPGSFFPSIGGAQGSMLNFISLFNEEEDIVLLALGLRGFFFSLFLKENFSFACPILEN